MKKHIIKMEFEEKLARLQPIELLGIARTLRVEVAEPSVDPDAKPIPRSGSAIIADMRAAYYRLNRTQKRNLNLLLNSLVAHGKQVIIDGGDRE